MRLSKLKQTIPSAGAGIHTQLAAELMMISSGHTKVISYDIVGQDDG